MAFLPAGIGAGQTFLLWVIARYPHMANSSVPITDSNYRQVYVVTRRALLLIALIMNVLVAGLFAITAMHGLGAMVYGFIGVAVVLVLWISIRLKRQLTSLA